MKKYTVFIVLFFTLTLAPRVMAAVTTTPTPSKSIEASASGEKTKKLEELKDRLATKVAELRQTQRKALYGTVSEVSLVSLSVETANKNVKLDLSDNLKIVQLIKDKRTVLSISDLAKGDIITAFGQFDSTIDLLTPKIIVIQKKPSKHIQGKIKEVNKTDFSISVETNDTQVYVVDIESTTKTLSWTTAGGIVKSGFSKLTVGDTVLVTGQSVPKKDLRLSADRVVNIGSLSPTPAQTTEAPSPTSTPSATPVKK
ncbi:hypothetical protein HY947_01645 [Candidatus Gottesmanbacteria bacterium]|nr:hypothetical protein [Candidatus Gottesmanbacteria bacterium]